MNDTDKNEQSRSKLKPKAGNFLRRRKRYLIPFVFTFIIMFATWIVLSGQFDLFHLSLGVASCAGVAYFSCDLLFESSKIKGIPMVWLRFLHYIPWLLYQIFMANLHVLYLVFHPRMMDLIDPQIIRFKSNLQDKIALVVFANSITLTPGTITVSLSIYGYYTIHAIDHKSGDALPGEMQERIGKIFPR